MSVYRAEQLSCCGYFNATAQGAFTVQTGFCAPGGAGVANNGLANPCVTPIGLFAESAKLSVPHLGVFVTDLLVLPCSYLLENVFTTARPPPLPALLGPPAHG